MRLDYVVVLSEEDPVARAVGDCWGPLPPVEGSSFRGTLRWLGPNVAVLRRPGLHIHDEGLRIDGIDAAAPRPTLVFPSVHRSVTSRETLTVHPLGNPTGDAELGGAPATLVPTDARRMTTALRRWAEVGRALGWPTSFEATHHGPGVDQPAFFVEIGAADFVRPPEAAVRGLAALLPELVPDPSDRVAVGVGGGHYAPHFTELALERRWAFGHLIPEHGLAGDPERVVRRALEATPGAEGILLHRARDVERLPAPMAALRRRESEAPRRDRPSGTVPSTPTPGDASRSLGT